jgi:SNF2 family DNA or RNA helicase
MNTKLAAQMAEGQILAVNEAVKASKLVQIACGVTYGVDGQELEVPNGPRAAEVLKIVEESEGKVLVFVPFTGALNAIANEMSKNFPVAVVQGSTTKSQRDQIFADFQQQEDPRVIVANPGTMSHGLTLTAATTIVWFAPTWSAETYEQACARVRRPGQTKRTVIVHIAGTDIERRIYKRLAEKQSMQGILLDMASEQEMEAA